MKRITAPFFLIIFGAIFLIAGLWIRSSTSAYENGITTTGTIVDVVTNTTSDGTTYAAVVEFVAENGQTYRVADQISTSSFPQTGTIVEVSYEPSNPQGARNLDQSTWFAWIFVGIGGVVLLLGAGMLLKALAIAGLFVGALIGSRDSGGSGTDTIDTHLPIDEHGRVVNPTGGRTSSPQDDVFGGL